MGFHGLSFGQLILMVLLAILVFGTRKLRDVGEDLGAAVKSFRRAMREEEPPASTPPEQPPLVTHQSEDKHSS